ncbi:hypothetical protein M758_UG335100 [Ceratodon purpureus]|nr:hypothetical protein M758_UG335100 [Ceratodon purpureus]
MRFREPRSICCKRLRLVQLMSVDVKRGEKLPIHINMTFPAMPCEVLSLDAIDMSGKHEVDLHTNIWKLRIHKDGYVLGSKFVNDLIEGEHKKEEHKDGHKDALKGTEGHGHDEHGTHDEVAGLPIHRHLSQRDPHKVIKEVKEAIDTGEGCQIYGVLDVEHVAGNFHISMHGLSLYVASKVLDFILIFSLLFSTFFWSVVEDWPLFVGNEFEWQRQSITLVENDGQIFETGCERKSYHS